MNLPTDAITAHRVLLVIGLVAGALLLAFVLVYLFNVVLLVFAAALLAVLMRAPTDYIARHTAVTPGWALTFVLIVATALIVTAAWLFGHNIVQQAGQLAEQLPKSIEQLRQQLSQFGWAGFNAQDLLPDNIEFLGRSYSIVTSIVGALTTFFILILMAIFLAAQPSLYINGLLHLIPKDGRERVRTVLREGGHVLRWWVVGRAFLMVLVGLLVGVGLWLLGVSYALALGILAGLLTFIPYIGPVLSFIPAALVALVGGGASQLFYVTVLYIGAQMAENSLQPVVQQRAIHLPPALIIAVQVALGILAGMLGFMVATPFLAFLMVAVKLLYVKDVLGDSEGARV